MNSDTKARSEGAGEEPLYMMAMEDRILEATQAPLRRHRRLHQVKRLAIPVAAFLLGATVTRFSQGEVDGDPPRGAPVVAVVEGAAPKAPDNAPGDDAGVMSPLDLEVRARTATGPERWRLLRLAGDAWLQRGGNVAAATRCYESYLRHDGGAGMQSGDSWLLAQLKAGRL